MLPDLLLAATLAAAPATDPMLLWPECLPKFLGLFSNRGLLSFLGAACTAEKRVSVLFCAQRSSHQWVVDGLKLLCTLTFLEAMGAGATFFLGAYSANACY